MTVSEVGPRTQFEKHLLIMSSNCHVRAQTGQWPPEIAWTYVEYQKESATRLLQAGEILTTDSQNRNEMRQKQGQSLLDFRLSQRSLS
jgi:hypothetical protein